MEAFAFSSSSSRRRSLSYMDSFVEFNSEATKIIFSMFSSILFQTLSDDVGWL